MISVDTETTGVDLYHGATAFFVTTCKNRENTWWEWDVDPLTRRVVPVTDRYDLAEDLEYIKSLLLDGDEELVLQNGKFDVTALAALDPEFGQRWPWQRTHDTLVAGHLLASNRKHDLTSMVVQYLGWDVKPYEDELERVVKECRRAVQQARLKIKRQAARGEEVVSKKKGKGKSKLKTMVAAGLFDNQEPEPDEVDERDIIGQWKIAEEGLEGSPSVKNGTKREQDKPWKNDTWLPRALALLRGIDDPDHPYLNVTREYANSDSAATLALWPVMWDEICRRGLDKIYNSSFGKQRMRLAYLLERRGVTYNQQALEELREEYKGDSERAGRVCVNIAADYGYELSMPKGAANNNSLTFFCFGKPLEGHSELFPNRDTSRSLDLPIVHRTEGGAPSLDAKTAIPTYLVTLEQKSKQLQFIKSLAEKRKRDTAIGFLNAYERFALPLMMGDDGAALVGRLRQDDRYLHWRLLHPGLNPCGTDTLRWSSYNPNEQNVSKQGMPCGLCYGTGCKFCDYEGLDPRSVRYVFGPAPGREWWSCDAKNLELRIPAYESGEEDIIALFENPDEPPYYGSNHLLNFHTVYLDIWEGEIGKVCKDCCKGRVVDITRVGPHCKKKFAATWYQWCKNGGFAVQYGAVDRPDGGGTADVAFHRSGSHARLTARFRALEAHNRKCIRFANKHGYVETIPDRTVDPKRGYPLLCTRTEYGKILETVPLNYRTQGTAMQWTSKGMDRCQEQLDRWREESGFDGFITMQVHDEMVFDFPKVGDPVKEWELTQLARANHSRPPAHMSNLWRAQVLKALMAKGGDDIGVPTPVGLEFHPVNWAEGITI